MKKLMIWVLVAALATIVGTVSATSIDELTTPAQFVPHNAPFFAAIRTDEAYIETLDGVLSNILGKLPPGEIPDDANFPFLLDEALRNFTDDSESTFTDDVRPWLGDWMVITLESIEALDSPDGGIMTILEITDFDSAASFLEAELLEREGYNDYKMTELEDRTLQFNSGYFVDPVIRLMEDKLLIGGAESLDALPNITTDDPALFDNEHFQNAANALTEEDYNIFAYIDTELVMTALAESSQEAQSSIDLLDLEEAFGQIAVGLTLLGGRSLTIDIANTGSESITEVNATPIDLSLLGRLSAQTSLVIQGEGLGDHIKNILDMFYKMDNLLKDQGMQGILPQEEAPGFLANLGMDDIATFLRLAVEGTYRIDLDETLAWMDDDYLLYAGARIDANSPIGVAPEGGLLMRTSDSDATAEFVEKLIEMAANAFKPTTFEDGVGTIPLGALISMSEFANLTLTSNDEFLMIGTIDTVNFALFPDENPSPIEKPLVDTANYAYESELFLEDTYTLLYVDVAPLRAVMHDLIKNNMIPDITKEESATIASLMRILESSSITANLVDGVSHARITLTLGE